MKHYFFLFNSVLFKCSYISYIFTFSFAVIKTIKCLSNTFNKFKSTFSFHTLSDL